MKNKLHILMVAPEMAPFAKVGGLADVIGALPKALLNTGHDVRIVMPYYREIKKLTLDLERLPYPLGVRLGHRTEWCAIVKTSSDNVPVYLIEHDLYFNRDGIYHNSTMRDYNDNPLRFGFLTKVALQLARQLNVSIDVFHIHDWPTALLAVYLKLWGYQDDFFNSCASVLTIHNMMYQGVYSKHFYSQLDLPWQFFQSDVFETYDSMNMLKGGIYFADVVNTVSPSYSYEVRRLDHEAGLAVPLYRKGSNFVGILNGVDYSIWSPEHDEIIPAQFSRKNRDGKRQCKKYLQQTFMLNTDNHIALIGTIGRFVTQKGFHLIAQIIDAVLVNMHVQFVILGSGDQKLEDFFRDLPARHPGKTGSFIGFSNELAHLIEAGCDFFLMPSLFEPCGLNQIYSQKYGTLPIVHATGGLDDTVQNYNEQKGEGTGFKFYEASPEALYYTIGWAISTYYDRREHMNKLINNAMLQDFSWQKSAAEYEKLYEQAIQINREN